MTFKQLYEYKNIKFQIEQLKEKIYNLSYISSSSTTSNINHSNNISNPVEKIISKKIRLQKKLERKLDKLYDQELKIETFIDDIDDVEIEIIVRMRFLELKTWNEISKKLKYDRSSLYKKVKRYLEEYNKEHPDETIKKK